MNMGRKSFEKTKVLTLLTSPIAFFIIETLLSKNEVEQSFFVERQGKMTRRSRDIIVSQLIKLGYVQKELKIKEGNQGGIAGILRLTQYGRTRLSYFLKINDDFQSDNNNKKNKVSQ
ncbi:MAG: hypothetical protein WC781_05460 [Candidatus Pacearchaeota archaeon]|jgi:hypothetical protein